MDSTNGVVGYNLIHSTPVGRARTPTLQAFKLQGLILTHDGFVRMRVRRRERRGDKDGAVACWADATVASCSGGSCDDGDSADGGVTQFQSMTAVEVERGLVARSRRE